MTTRFLAATALACAAAVSLSGCTTAQNSANAQLLTTIDQNFQHCARHITFAGGIGVITPGAQVSGSIDCPAQAQIAPAPVAPAAVTPPVQ